MSGALPLKAMATVAGEQLPQVEIACTRGNHSVLGRIALRARELHDARLRVGASRIESTSLGLRPGVALLLRTPAVRDFVVDRCRLACAAGEPARVALYSERAGMMTLAFEISMEARDFERLLELPDVVVDRALGELECPSCGFVNTLAGLHSPEVAQGCVVCGHEMHACSDDAVLQS